MDPIIDNESLRARFALLSQQFSELDDDREASRVVYPIEEVLLLVTCPTIASRDDFEDIVEWGEHHLDFLRQFSDFHHGIACARWLRELVNRIDPALFACCFKELGRPGLASTSSSPSTARPSAAPTIIAKGSRPCTLSAYATNARLTLAQLCVPENTNEITAIPELLDHLAPRPRPQSQDQRQHQNTQEARRMGHGFSAPGSPDHALTWIPCRGLLVSSPARR